MKFWNSINADTRRSLILIAFIAIAVRLLFFVYALHSHTDNLFYQGDAQGYLRIANNIVAGNGFSMSTTSPYLPDSIRTPILPLVLSAFIYVFHNPVSFVFFQLFLSALLVLVTFFIARMFVERETYALLASAFVVLEPFSVFIHLQVLTEVIFTLLVAAGAYCAFKYIAERELKYIAAASAIFGLAALTRPIGEFLPLLLILFLLPELFKKNIFKKIVFAILPFLIVVSPWIVRNYEAFHSIGLSSGGFQNVYSDLGGTIISLRDHIEWYKAKNALEEDFAKRHNVPRESIQQDLSLSPLLLKEGIAIAIGNPIPTALSVATVGVAFFTNDLWSYYLEHLDFISDYSAQFSPSHSFITDGVAVTVEKIITIMGPRLVIPLAGRIFWVLVCALFVFGLFRLWKQGGAKRMLGLLALTIILYFFVLSVSNGAGINGRYRYPASPVIFVLASVGLEGVIALMRRKSKRT